MGMYDEITFGCPVCSDLLVEQSKAGDCCLMRYPEDAVPIHIADDIVGELLYCEQCERSYKISFCGEDVPRTVPLKLVKP